MKLRLLLLAPLLETQLLAAQNAVADRTFAAPPTPPPIERREGAVPADRLRSAAAVYSIGDPTPEEQLYIELINRARANPIAEAQILSTTTDPMVLANYDFYDVNLLLMQQNFATNPPAPPVAPNAQLLAAARRHTQDMLSNSFQGHDGTDGTEFFERITQACYTYSTVGENVYANAESVFHGHAGFEVDWGNTPGAIGGMQNPPGHRNTIHDASFREVGVGVLFGRNTPAPGNTNPFAVEVGPQLVTQEFGTRFNATPFITGVAYYDLNANNFYDIGEGIGGVRVSASGTATTSVTADSGGYALPVAGNGTYTVTFSGDGLGPVTRQVIVTQNQNQKADYLPAYVAPAITGPSQPIVNRTNQYQISAVPGAVAYQWRSVEMLPPVLEGAEDGAGNVIIEQFGTYPVIQTATKKSGVSAFHLAHPQVREQRITLNRNFHLDSDSMLRFASRLGWATPNQRAVVQISTNNGATWREIYSQAGTESAGERLFVDRSVALGEFAGATARFRLTYVPSGLSYIDVDDETGWFIDDILVEGALEIGNEQVQEAANRSFTFQPPAIKDYVLQARARAGHEFLPWGPQLAVTPREGGPTPLEARFSTVRVIDGQIEFEVDLSVEGAGNFRLYSKTSLSDPWTETPIARIDSLSPTRVRLGALRGGGSTGFYRLSTE